MLNRVILMGRLVADPELKTTGTGISVTSFRIAVERSYVKTGEERKADFFDIVCWRNSAEFVCRYFSKGSMIAIDGQLQSRTYQAKDGTSRYVVEVVADSVSFTGERRENAGGYGNQSYGGQSYNDNQSYQAAPQAQIPDAPASYQSNSNTNFQDMPYDDDLPF
ncbi:MAG: single-stranded DNA-binding protein [Ruminococcus sp.]|nr:single-stranded DNA-binding protein [Ruminococcus sp.]